MPLVLVTASMTIGTPFEEKRKDGRINMRDTTLRCMTYIEEDFAEILDSIASREGIEEAKAFAKRVIESLEKTPCICPGLMVNLSAFLQFALDEWSRKPH